MRLLACIRVILGIEVITDDHIQLGKDLVDEFGKLIPVFQLRLLSWNVFTDFTAR
jgi:hypothetical protein